VRFVPLAERTGVEMRTGKLIICNHGEVMVAQKSLFEYEIPVAEASRTLLATALSGHTVCYTVTFLSDDGHIRVALEDVFPWRVCLSTEDTGPAMVEFAPKSA